MKIPTLGNAKKNRDGFYIGREFAGLKASPWLNPFAVGQDTWENRMRAVWKYTRWIFDQPVRLDLESLRIQERLVCWCTPSLCHGHVLQWMLEAKKLIGVPCPQCGAPIEQSILNGHQIERIERVFVYEAAKCRCGHYFYRPRAELVEESIPAWAAAREDQNEKPTDPARHPVLALT